MKATLTFDLPEENEEHLMAINGWKYRLALSNLNEFLRAKIKYGDFSEEIHDVYQQVRDQLHEQLNDNSIEL